MQHHGLYWLLLWPAISFAVVAGAYACRQPTWLGKRQDGSRHWLSTLLLTPYLFVQYALWHLLRIMSSEAVAHEVAPNVWLGRRPLSKEVPTPVTHVVDVSSEFVEETQIRKQYQYVCLPTLDATAPPLAALRQAAQHIICHQQPVLIHCAAGHGRSALLAAYVMVLRGDATDAADALTQIVRVRPGVQLTDCQQQALLLLTSTP